MKTGLIAFLTLVLFAAPTTALTLDPLPGWVTADDIEKAVEVAKKKGCPIAFLHAPQEGGAEVVMARVYMKLTVLEGMVKVLVYDSKRPPTTFTKVASQVEAPSEGLPLLYIASPDLKILGFIEKGGHKKTGGRVAEVAWGTWKWIKKSKADIEAAEKGMEIGRFGTALKTFRRIAEEQKDFVVEVTKTWNVVLKPEETKPIYFPELSAKLDAVPAAAASYLDKAREAFNKKDYKEAKRLLGPMVADKCELDSWTQASELLAKVDEAIKAK